MDLQDHAEASLAKLTTLDQSILAQAFRGELVPTEAELARREGRAYEPARALLACIKAERKQSKRAKKKPPYTTTAGQLEMDL